ncbi:MAG: protein kinase [Myxococcota bacterium]
MTKAEEDKSLPSVGSKYRIVRRVKRGGMAEIFEARLLGERGFQRRLAIKRPLTITTTRDLDSFADEARILSQLSHPNIVSVFDLGEHDGWPFQVMEFVDGFDLGELHRRGSARNHPMPVTVALEIVARVGDALDYAHTARGSDNKPLEIVHRDVSPENVLVSNRAEVKLTDFGIAFARARLARTQTGLVRGKLSFMSPEQLNGVPVTPRTDIFSLGCVLHAMVDGASPLLTWKARAQLASGVPLPVARNLPDNVRRIIERAIQPNADLRYPRGSDFADACRAAATEYKPDRLSDWLDRVLHDESEPETRPAGNPLQAVMRLEPLPDTPISDPVRVAVSSDLMESAPTALADAQMLPSSPDERDPSRTLGECVPEVSEPSLSPPPPIRINERVSERANEHANEHVSERLSHDRFGRFENLERQSKDDVGTVYSGTLDGRLVLIRTVPASDATDPAAIGRFFSEATLMCKIDHPHVLRVLDFGANADCLYVAFEHPGGIALTELLQRATRKRRGPDSTELSALAVGITEGIAEVQAANALPGQSLRNLSVRTRNVWLTPDGRVALFDFVLPNATAENSSAQAARALANCLLEVVAGEPVSLKTSPSVARKTLAQAGIDRKLTQIVIDAFDPHAVDGLKALTAQLARYDASVPKSPEARLTEYVQMLIADNGIRMPSPTPLSRDMESLTHRSSTGIVDEGQTELRGDAGRPSWAKVHPVITQRFKQRSPFRGRWAAPVNTVVSWVTTLWTAVTDLWTQNSPRP